MLKRRDIIKRLLLGAGIVSVAPSTVWAGDSIVRLDPIIPAAFADFKKGLLLAGRKFKSSELEDLYRHRRIAVQPLGVCVTRDGKDYDIEELRIPIGWWRSDTDNNSESQLVCLAASIVENAIDSHDDLLLEKIGNKRAVVSYEYRYVLGPVHALSDDSRYVKLHTAFCVTD